MQPISDKIYQLIDNSVYNTQEDIWWNENKVLHLLRTSINPVRVNYFKRILDQLQYQCIGKSALDVGCGGGILAEEFAGIGFNVTGIDPSAQSLETASLHAKILHLSINYRKGAGESIPFSDNSFDVVYCCDVLEHVRDLPKVISEICRVLKPGNPFLFDTLNRTFISKLVAIKIWQEWKSTAFMPPNLHVWKMFIKPDELQSLLQDTGFVLKEFRGTSPNVSILKMISILRQRAKGKIGYKELGNNSNSLKATIKIFYTWVMPSSHNFFHLKQLYATDSFFRTKGKHNCPARSFQNHANWHGFLGLESITGSS